MALKERVLAGGKLRVLVYVATQLTSWCIALLTVRFLVPEDYGVMAVGTVIVAFGEVIASLGMPAYIMQTRRMRLREIRHIAGFLVTAYVAISITLSVGAPLAAEFFAIPELKPVLLILSACLIVRSFGIAPHAWLQRVIKFKEVAALEACAMMGSSALGLALAIAGQGALALAGRTLATVIIGTVLSMWMTRWRVMPLFGFGGLGRPLRFGLRITVIRILEVIQLNADRLILTRMIGTEALGLYTLGTAMARVAPTLIMTPIMGIVLPALSRLGAQDPRRARYLLRGNDLLAFVFFPVCWGGALIAPDVVPLAIGKDWSGLVPILQLIAAYLPIHLLSRLIGPALIAAGRPELDIRNVSVRLVFVSIGTAAGAFFGPVWAAFGWVAGSFIALAINMRYSLPVLGASFSELARGVGVTAICAGFMALTVWGISTGSWLEGFGAIWKLIATVTVGAAVYTLSSLLFNQDVARLFIATSIGRGLRTTASKSL